MEASETKDYEIGFLSKDEAGKAALLEAVRKHEGEVLLEGPLERITLAYPIKKETAAYFGYVHVRLAKAQSTALARAIDGIPEVLRHLLITPPYSKARPRPAPRPRPLTSAPLPVRPAAPEPMPLSNEALEKKIEEILKQ